MQSTFAAICRLNYRRCESQCRAICVGSNRDCDFVYWRPSRHDFCRNRAVALFVVPLVREHRVQCLFAATILMGVIQIVAGLLRLDLLMQFVSRSVITGFVNALATLIFMAQLPELTNVGWETYAMVAGGLAIIYLFPRLTHSVPSPLVAIIILSAIKITGVDVNKVADMEALPQGLPSFALPDVPLNLETLQIILPYSLAMAAVGLLESLLTAQIDDDDD